MLSIKTRIVLSSAIVFGVVLVVFAVIIYHNIKRAENEKFDALIESKWTGIQAELEEGSNTEAALKAFESESPGTAPLPGMRVELLDSTGHPIYADSTGHGLWALIKSGDPSVDADTVVKDGREVPDVIRGKFRLNDDRYRFFAAPVELYDSVRCELLIAAPMLHAEDRLARLRLQFIVAIPLALLLASLGAWFIAQMAFRPVTEMILTSSAITADHLGRRLSVPRAHDEVRLLGETLNKMMDRIASAFTSQQQFVADASHELRTPLTVIRTELEFALRTVHDAQARESIDIALSEIDRLTGMAEQLLQLSRLDASPDAIRHEPVRLDELAADAVQSFRSLAAQKQITIVCETCESIEYQCDEEKMTTVLHTLIENAVLYSPCEGGIVVRVSRDPSGAVCIAVEDTGAGIAEADLPHLFRRFYRGEQVRGTTEGSGLGLAIAEKIIVLHGGRIDVSGNHPHGAVFTITLPA